jgi:hypothetical protein
MVLVKGDIGGDMRFTATQTDALLYLKELWRKSASWRTATGRRIKRLADGSDEARRILEELATRQSGATTLRSMEKCGFSEWGDPRPHSATQGQPRDACCGRGWACPTPPESGLTYDDTITTSDPEASRFGSEASSFLSLLQKYDKTLRLDSKIRCKSTKSLLGKRKLTAISK